MSNQKAPINPEREVARDPIAFLLDARRLGVSGAIENQEAEGQHSFVNSDTLPTDMPKQDRLALEHFGVTFHGPVENDPLFQYVELPAGWKKQASDHAMWSHLVDDKGRVRASIFYKAAFYDRVAHLQVERRFSVRYDYTLHVGQVVDSGQVVHQTAPHDDSQIARASASLWLAHNYPDWQNTEAYWD